MVRDPNIEENAGSEGIAHSMDPLPVTEKPDPESLSTQLSAAGEHTETNRTSRGRILIWPEAGLVAKAPPVGPTPIPWAVECLSDLIASNLAAVVEAPALWQVPVTLEDRSIALVMPYLDGAKIDIASPTEYVNADEIPITVAFEEWVANIDDKPEHFRAVSTDRGREFRVIDHGHSLLRTLNHLKEGRIEEFDQLRAPLGRNPYPTLTTEQVASGVRRIQSVSDASIQETVERSITELEELEPDTPEFADLLAEKRMLTARITTLLRARRDALDSILSAKFG